MFICIVTSNKTPITSYYGGCASLCANELGPPSLNGENHIENIRSVTSVLTEKFATKRGGGGPTPELRPLDPPQPIVIGEQKRAEKIVENEPHAGPW